MVDDGARRRAQDKDRCSDWAAQHEQRLCHSAPGAVPDVDGGLVPAVLEALEQARDDFGCDVGVGALDRVFEDVAESE